MCGDEPSRAASVSCPLTRPGRGVDPTRPCWRNLSPFGSLRALPTETKVEGARLKAKVELLLTEVTVETCRARSNFWALASAVMSALYESTSGFTFIRCISWFVVSGFWLMGYGLWFMVCGLWFTAQGLGCGMLSAV